LQSLLRDLCTPQALPACRRFRLAPSAREKAPPNCLLVNDRKKLKHNGTRATRPIKIRSRVGCHLAPPNWENSILVCIEPCPSKSLDQDKDQLQRPKRTFLTPFFTKTVLCSWEVPATASRPSFSHAKLPFGPPVPVKAFGFVYLAPSRGQCRRTQVAWSLAVKTGDSALCIVTLEKIVPVNDKILCLSQSPASKPLTCRVSSSPPSSRPMTLPSILLPTARLSQSSGRPADSRSGSTRRVVVG
jgi:hypothetical protein